MDPHFIKCFIQSIQNVFSTMLQLSVTVREPTIKQNTNTTSDVSGIIGFNGDVVGTIALGLPRETAERVVALFSGQKLAMGTPDFADAIGELINMVSGGAKALFKDKKVSMSCPSVVFGANHVLSGAHGTTTVVIPCVTDCGNLALELAIKALPTTPKAPAATAAQAV